MTPKTVLVFGRRYQIPLSKVDVEEAWRAIPIPSHGRASINYPRANAFGVFYGVGSTTISHGPYQADPGTYGSMRKWNIRQHLQKEETVRLLLFFISLCSSWHHFYYQ